MKGPYQRHLITSALPYANGPLHIGHLAGAYLPADIYARYLRAIGEDVLYVCGSDEHGVAITIQAAREQTTPQALVDRYHTELEAGFRHYRISVDQYSRTSLPIHHETAQEFFTNFHEKGLLVEQESEQYFDPVAQLFLADRYIIGTCPKCGNENAYGDQCEKCGSALSPTELINPRSTLSGAHPELRPTRHWYLPLDKWQERIAHYVLDEHPEWKPNVYGQCKSWLQEGLQPRAITRDMSWGIPVPLASAEGKVLYVWFDAPIGYISASRHWAQQRAAKDPDQFSPDDWKPYWQDKGTRLVHFIGKDNIVFHCIIFPAMLMAHGDYIWADQVPANEFLNLEGDKISTSRNWAVWANTFAEEHPDLVDVMRYVLTATLPETKDNEFTWKDFQARNNNELVAILSNFVHRVVTLCHKYFNGIVPAVDALAPLDQQALAACAEQAQLVSQSLSQFRFREGLQEAMNLARAGNKYLTDTEPWHLAKTQPERLPAVLYTSLQIVAGLSIIFSPFLPETAEKIAHLLQIPALSWSALATAASIPLVPAGQAINQAQMLYIKLDDEFVNIQRQKLVKTPPTATAMTTDSQAPQSETTPAESALSPIKAPIEYAQFEPLDIRVATIAHAERIPKADKLLKLTLNTGVDTRTVVSGIAQHYSPEAIIGKQVLVLANLAPRALRGIESQGMILMAEDATGRLIFVSPEGPFANGATVR
jgi:methionyl-tRNA synthetase